MSSEQLEENIKFYGGKDAIMNCLLSELKKGEFSDCDEEFQKCCYYLITNLRKNIDELIEQYSKNDYYYKYNGKYLKSEIINEIKSLKGW